MSYEEIYQSKLMTAEECVDKHIKHGDKIFISIGSSRHNGEEGIKIVVDNPGGTVNDDFRAKILKKGYTTKTTDTDKHGLGLFILQNMVKKHSGSLMLSNQSRDNIQYISFTLLL